MRKIVLFILKIPLMHLFLNEFPRYTTHNNFRTIENFMYQRYENNVVLLLIYIIYTSVNKNYDNKH